MALFEIIKEIWQNRHRMLRVVWFDIKIENRSLYLGTLWQILAPFFQVGTFWLIFGLGIRGGAPVDGFPFIIWLLSGLIPWFFINRGVMAGSSSIVNKAAIIFKIKYPIATVPVGEVICCLYDHIILLGIMFAIFLIHGVYPSLYWLNLIYYISFTFVLLTAVTMILSVVIRLAPDFERLLGTLMQMLFFLTPILWEETYLPPWVQRIFSANPIRYIVMGFRGSLLYQENFFDFPWRIAFFWPMVIVLLIFGCWLQKKFASRFVDWM